MTDVQGNKTHDFLADATAGAGAARPAWPARSL